MPLNNGRFLKWIEGSEWNTIPWNLRQEIFSAGSQKLPIRVLPEEDKNLEKVKTMKVLVRNQAQVSECALFQANDIPGEEIISRPEVRELIGDRRLRAMEYFQSDDTIFVELDLASQRPKVG